MRYESGLPVDSVCTGRNCDRRCHDVCDLVAHSYAEELALLYSFALGEEGLSYSKLVTITGLRGRIILLATPAVIESAERAVNLIIDLYQGPRLTREEVRQRIENKSLNAIGEFARCCREELIALRLV
jgi:hypothetical protein